MDQRLRAPEAEPPVDEHPYSRPRAVLVDASAPGRPDDGPSTRVHVLQLIGDAIAGGMKTWVERLVERLPRQRFRKASGPPAGTAGPAGAGTCAAAPPRIGARLACQ